MLLCPQCSAANPPDSLRCLRCGLSLVDLVESGEDPEDAATVAIQTTDLRAPTIHLVLTLGRDLVRDLRSDKVMINIGRETTQDLAINNAGISRQHCRIAYEGGRFFLRDLDSENGIEVNGERVTSAVLRPGDEIGLGKYSLYFEPRDAQLAIFEHNLPPSLARPEEVAAEHATAMLRCDDQEQNRRAREARKAAHLRRLDRHGRTVERCRLAGRETILGSGSDADVFLEGIFVRPAQAIIEADSRGHLLRSLGGWRPVRVNGYRVRGERRLRNHDRIRIGRTELRFYAAL